jgi:hypothetical protein
MSLNLSNQKLAQTAEEKSTETKLRLLWRSSWDLLDIYGLSFHPTTAKPRTCKLRRSERPPLAQEHLQIDHLKKEFISAHWEANLTGVPTEGRSK